ncbi:MAG: endopeptidase La, partial [Phototrophicales bacterium]
QYLVKRQIRENGLRPDEIEYTDEALLEIIREYTREAGVRTLEREIARIARKVVTKIAAGDSTKVVVTKDVVRDYLGNPKYGYRTEIEERTDLPGVATGLAWTPVGGDVLFIEATRMAGGKGFQITGRLGDVMQESAKLALSYIRAKANELNIDADFYANNDIHIHVPEGAVPKDGPSAGVTLTVALVSLLTNRPTKRNVAMTGEITLQGKILPVGGIKDKVLAAHRLGVDTVILPRKNEHDLDDVPEEVRKALTFILVDDLDTALQAALVPATTVAPIIPTTPPTPKQEIQPPAH